MVRYVKEIIWFGDEYVDFFDDSTWLHRICPSPSSNFESFIWCNIPQTENIY
jgi:hypothetical protein